MLRKQQIPSAAIVIFAASFSFCCETRETKFQAGYNIQSGQHDSHRKQNDAVFLKEVSNDLLLEAQLAELAIKKASSPEVKEFAVSVLTSHQIAMEEIQAMASRIGVPLSQEVPSAGKKHYLRVAAKEDLQFDRAYCDFMFVNNTMVLKRFEKIAQEGNDEQLKDWAWGKLGIIRRHIAISQHIEHGGSDPALEAGT